ncbi:MAG: MotA/TolQ/ExbB proton channel family protein [Bacteroidota bacterium]|nr:MotA/TolQ/ExbB proton channel family protein [Bacteroidota bacterium]MDE2957404.1 MotA/TolQ/ExbB proton channel family protein [Bacteroidota bacterium]
MNDLVGQMAAADSLVLPVDPGGRVSALDLLGQAGGFQWPILATLAVGLVVLMLCLVRLFFDRRASGCLIGMPVDSVTQQQLETALAQSEGSLYARFLKGLLVVHRAGGAFHALGQEIKSISAAAHASYQRTERLVAYCSSTAGGLGLLGTLVGIYTLFSAGTRDPQVIFAGIAVAVASTLLGLVVSILLELLETLAHRWVSRYAESAEAWAIRVRYRLSECGDS